MITYDLSDEKPDKIRPENYLNIWTLQIQQRHLIDDRTGEAVWVDGPRKSDSGLWEARPAAIALVAFNL